MVNEDWQERVLDMMPDEPESSKESDLGRITRAKNASARALASGSSGAGSLHARSRGVCCTIRGTLISAAWAGFAGRYNLDTLIARHGADFGIPNLLRLLSDDCPKRRSITAYDLCGIYCPDLPSFFLGSGSRRGAL